jgi:hypothetical protein
MGYGVHNSGESSGEFVIERAGEDTIRRIDGWNTRVEQNDRLQVDSGAMGFHSTKKEDILTIWSIYTE